MSKEILALEKEVANLKRKLGDGSYLAEGKEASLKKSIKKLNRRISKLRATVKEREEANEAMLEHYQVNRKTDFQKRRERSD